MDAAVLEDHEDDPVAEEMISAIHALAEDEQVELVAIAWLGRGDGTVDDWESAERRRRRRPITAARRAICSACRNSATTSRRAWPCSAAVAGIRIGRL